jgi:hypothetical protein
MSNIFETITLNKIDNSNNLFLIKIHYNVFDFRQQNIRQRLEKRC